MEPATNERELVEVDDLESHVDHMTVYCAVQSQSVLAHALEGKICLPIFVVSPCEGDGLVVDIDRGTIVHK